jgi:hypothetical protein
MMEWLELEPGVAVRVTLIVPEENAPYAPCFAMNVWDARGENVVAQPLCLERMRPSDVLNNPIPPTWPRCGVTAAPRAGLWWALLPALSLLALALRRVNKP